MLELKRDTPRRRQWPPLRCKPGELAMVTRLIDYYGRDRNMLGMVFRVVAVVSSPFGNPCWTYEGPLRDMQCNGQTWRIDSVADAGLTPLRGDVASTDSSSHVAQKRRAPVENLIDLIRRTCFVRCRESGPATLTGFASVPAQFLPCTRNE